MRLFLLPALCLGFGLLPSFTGLRAEDKKPKITTENAKDMLDKLVGEAKKAAGKFQEGEKGGTLWPHSKESLSLSKDEYLKRADSAMKSMDAEIKALAEAEGAVITRDYFKTHVESLRLHLAYCKQDGERLKSADSEEAFRVKQKKFDRTLSFLADNIQLARDEAGL
jgi:hypothetical protein